MSRMKHKVEPAAHLSMHLSFLTTSVQCDPFNKEQVHAVWTLTIYGFLLGSPLLFSLSVKERIPSNMQCSCI